jgi:GT2 family glycosyltransferase
MTPQITIIISYYKALHNLILILQGLQNQSDNSFDVIISEDDNNPQTVQFLKENQANYSFVIQHIFQTEDLGFRKNNMLNKAIMASKNDFLVFIDGDCIPHKHFVQAYKQNQKEGYFLAGRRVMLGEQLSKLMLKTSSIYPLHFWSLLKSDSYKVKEALRLPFSLTLNSNKGLLGCNWGVLKKDLVAVNGYDEDYVRAGVGEDNDIEWRLMEAGLALKSMKNKAIVYHIYHARSYSEEGVQANFKLWEEKKKTNHIRCLNGIEKL